MKLSVVPGWSLVPLKRVAEEVRVREDRVDSELPYVGMENVESWTGRIMGDVGGEQITGTCLRFEPGDVLFGKLRPYLAKVLLTRDAGHASTEFVGLRASDRLASHFLHYVLRSEPIVHWLSGLTYGARMPRVSPGEILCVSIPLPTGRVQEAIADFLDRETAHIDRLIEKKECLIALLEEKRSALITRAVTKGLDPDVPMKDSGVEWIGEIPEHWRVVPLKRILRSPPQYGLSEPARAFDPDDEELVRYVRITDISKTGRLREDGTAGVERRKTAGRLLSQGDILLARSGATVGKAFLVSTLDQDSTFAGYLIRIQADEEVVLPKWLQSFLESSGYWRWVHVAQTQATIPNVSAERYAQLPVPLPPVSEQRNILDVMNTASRSVRRLTGITRKSLTLLRERRSALITAAVTGQIDVDEYERSYRAPLAPDDPDLEASEPTPSAAVPDA